ncbi:transposase [Verticillium dahliae]
MASPAVLLRHKRVASTEGHLILAIQAVQNDQNINVRAAARIYIVSEMTLRPRSNDQRSQRDAPPNSRNLTDRAKFTFVHYVPDLDVLYGRSTARRARLTQG